MCEIYENQSELPDPSNEKSPIFSDLQENKRRNSAANQRQSSKQLLLHFDFQFESLFVHLDVMNAFFFVDVNSEDVRLGGDDGRADVDPAVGATTAQISLSLAIRQRAVLQDEISDRKRKKKTDYFNKIGYKS